MYVYVVLHSFVRVYFIYNTTVLCLCLSVWVDVCLRVNLPGCASKSGLSRRTMLVIVSA